MLQNSVCIREVLGNVWKRRDLIKTAVQIIYWGKTSRYGPRLKHNELNHEMNKPLYLTLVCEAFYSQVPALAGFKTIPSNLTFIAVPGEYINNYNEN